MKQIARIIFFLLTINQLTGQCPAGDVVLTTNADVVNYAIDYTNCLTIEGNLTISNQVSSLSPLLQTQLSNVNGNVSIVMCADLCELTGLNNLQTIGGVLKIENNLCLQNITALAGLNEIGENLIIKNNNSLVNLLNIGSLLSVGGNVLISELPALTSLNGLDALHEVGGNFTISNNPVLNDLTGIQDLEIIGGNMVIKNNNGLTNIAIQQLLQLQGVIIEGNPLLVGCDISFNNNHIFSGNVIVKENSNLTTLKLSPVTMIDGNLRIVDNPLLTGIVGMSAMDIVNGNILFSGNNSLMHLNNLSGLMTIGGNCTVGNNASLKTAQFTALENIGGLFTLQNNPLLDKFTFSPSLNNPIAPVNFGGFVITGNPNLSKCSVPPVCGFLYNNGTGVFENNAQGCNSQMEVVLHCACPEQLVVSATQDTICGNDTTLLSVIPIGGWPNLMYYWSPGDEQGDSYSFTAGPSEGSWTVTVTVVVNAGQNCPTPETYNIEVLELPNIQLSPDTTLCTSGLPLQVFIMSNTQDVLYQWSPPEYFSDPNIPDPLFNPPTPGQYPITASVESTVSACRSSGNMNIEVLESPVANAGPDQATCISDTTILEGMGADTLYWIYQNDTVGLGPILTLTPEDYGSGGMPNSMLYTLIAEHSNGCMDTDEVIIEVVPNPEPSMAGYPEMGPYIICPDSFIILTAVNDNCNASYIWSTGDTTQQTGPLHWSDYQDTSTIILMAQCEYFSGITQNTIYCTGVDTSMVAALPMPILETTDETCLGVADGSATILNCDEMTNIITWSTGDTSCFIANIQAGNYSVLDSFINPGCSVKFEFEILPGANIEFEVLQNGNNISLENISGGTPPYSYLWSTGDTIPAIMVSGPGTYKVTVIDTEGCEGDAEIVVIETATRPTKDELDFQLYPNPAKDWLYISYPDVDWKDASIQITDMTGRILLQFQEKVDMVKIVDLPPGIYCLRIYADGKLGVKSFAVQ